jgi:hypothetical protein
MPEIAEDEPLPIEEIAWYQQDNRAWIAVDDGDVPPHAPAARPA